MEPVEISRFLGQIFSSTVVTWDQRNRINAAFGEADTLEDLPEDIQQLIGQLNKTENRAAEIESRSAVSSVDRTIIKSPNICKQCRDNNDPNNVPVHPNCDCNVVTESVQTGVADSTSKYLNLLKNTDIAIDMAEGELLASQGIQLEPGSIAILDGENVRFADLARWLEQMQPYIDTGAQYMSIVVDDDSQELVENVDETLQEIAEGSTTVVEAIKDKKIWFSIAKVVAF